MVGVFLSLCATSQCTSNFDDFKVYKKTITRKRSTQFLSNRRKILVIFMRKNDRFHIDTVTHSSESDLNESFTRVKNIVVSRNLRNLVSLLLPPVVVRLSELRDRVPFTPLRFHNSFSHVENVRKRAQRTADLPPPPCILYCRFSLGLPSFLLMCTKPTKPTKRT